MTLIVRGSGLRFVGDSIEAFEAGDLVLLAGGVPHTWQSHDGVRDAESICIQFPPALLGDAADAGPAAWSGLPELSGLRRLLKTATRGLCIQSGPTHAAAVRHMTAAAAAPAGSAVRLIGLLSALEALASTPTAWRPLSDVAPVKSDDAAARAVRRVLDRLRQSLAAGEVFTQADAAALVGRSPASFSRFFRRHVGRSFVRYVNEWRVGLACRSLVQGDADVTTIAFDCGFGNLSNFNRRFRQIKGTTPGAIRRLGRPARADGGL